jgi:glycosyltransferase involved in cell wall biosynthesis
MESEHAEDHKVSAARRPIRVLNVFPGEATGSVMIFARKQVAAMHDCGVISDSFLLESRTSLRRLAREIRRFQDRMATFRPDLIHAQYGTMTAFFASLCTPVPLVMTFRGSDVNPTPSDWWVRSVAGRGLSHVAALKASRIICVSEGLRRRLWWRRARVVVIPSGIDPHVFFPRLQSEARSELGWKPEERIVLFNAGSSPAVKRLDLARDGIAEATKLAGPMRFIVLDGQVSQSVVAAMLNGADCLLMTSDWEGSPNIIKEALACNLPVVTVDAGDVRDRLQGVRPSYVVPRTGRDIGLALADLLRTRTRSNGAAVVKDLSLKQSAIRIRSVYDQVLNEDRITWAQPRSPHAATVATELGTLNDGTERNGRRTNP